MGANLADEGIRSHQIPYDTTAKVMIFSCRKSGDM